MTSKCSPEKLAYIFPIKIRGSRIRETRKENEFVFFRKLTPLKSKIRRCFLLLSLQESLKIWMFTFWGNCDVPSGFGSPGFLQRNHCRNNIGHKEMICQNFLLSQLLCCGQVPKFLVFIKPGLLKGGPVTQHIPMSHRNFCSHFCISSRESKS